MEGLTTIRVSDLIEILNELKEIRRDIKQFREAEESLKAYSIQKAAEMLNLHYNSVRKLIITGKIHAEYLHDDKGKCIIPYWSIRKFLELKKSK